MSNNSASKLISFRIYAQLLASIVKSSFLGLIAYFFTLVLLKNTYLRINNVFLGFVIFTGVVFFGSLASADNNIFSISYVKTLFLWMLPIIYYSLGTRDLNTHMYEKLLIIIFVYTIIEFMLINFTGISLFDSDRLRSAANYGYIRSEGVAHNSSISSALVISIFLKIYLDKRPIKKYMLITFASILLLGSGAGILIFIFALLFFVISKALLVALILIFFILTSVFFTQFPALEILNSIHPKISYEYILFLYEFKLEQISSILNGDNRDVIFGHALLNDEVLTSGDFGYATMIFAIGVIPSLMILFGTLIMFLRASRIGNFAPFLILMIETIHYPIFVDPISSYLLAQYAIAKRSEE
jgi:hypothetical protein